MIEKVIDWSSRNKFFIFLGLFFVVAWGIWALKNTPQKRSNSAVKVGR